MLKLRTVLMSLRELLDNRFVKLGLMLLPEEVILEQLLVRLPLSIERKNLVVQYVNDLLASTNLGLSDVLLNREFRDLLDKLLIITDYDITDVVMETPYMFEALSKKQTKKED